MADGAVDPWSCLNKFCADGDLEWNLSIDEREKAVFFRESGIRRICHDHVGGTQGFLKLQIYSSTKAWLKIVIFLLYFSTGQEFFKF